MFQVAHSLVEAVLLLQQQGGVKPGRGIARVDFRRQTKFLFRVSAVSRVAEGLAQVTAEQRALRLGGRRDLEVEPSFLPASLSNAAQAASQPGVAEPAVNGHGLLEEVDGFAEAVHRAEHETLQRERLRVAWGQREASLQAGTRPPGVAPAELQFGQ